MINIAVCDDEKYMADDVRKMTYKFFNSKKKEVVIKLFSNGFSLLESQDKFDIIFLDIQMSGHNGIEIAKILRERGCRAFIIFITVLKDAVFDSFEAEPFAYIVKPLVKEDFFNTMDRLYKKLLNTRNEKLFVKKKNEISIIDIEDIIYCEIINRKVYLHLINGETIEYYDKMKSLERKLDKRFFKCHRSYLLNLAYLNRYDNKTAYMKNGNAIPVSRLRIDELSHAVLEYISNNN